MNARELQWALVEDLEAHFSDKFYKTPNHTMEHPRAYAQHFLPRDAQTGDDPFPFIQVHLRSGGIASSTEPHKITVLLMIGIFDDGTADFREPSPVGEQWDNRNFGVMAVMEIIEGIQEHYEKYPTLGKGSFRYDGPFQWELDDEPTYPYFYGMCELSFSTWAPRIEGSEYT